MKAWAQSSDILKLLTKGQASKGGGRNALAVSPPVLNLKASVGSIAQAKLYVGNESSSDAIINIVPIEKIEVSPGVFKETSEMSFLPPDSIIKNMEISPKNPTLAAGAGREVLIKIKMVPGMKGTHYAALNVSLNMTGISQEKRDRSKYIMTSSMGIGAAQGVQLAVTALGTDTFDYSIKKATVTLPTSKQLLSGSIAINNTSSYSFAASVTAVVIDANKKPVTRFKPDKISEIRPGSEAQLNTGPSAVALPSGKYQMIFTVSGQEIPTKTHVESFEVH